MKDLKHRKCPLGPAFVGNILASRERAMFGSRIPVMKLLEKLRADTVAARGVHKGVWVRLGGEQEDLPDIAT